MLTVFFDSYGPLYQRVLLTNTTINRVLYCKVVQTLLYHVGRKRPHLHNQWLFHYNNARPHTSNATQDFLDSEFIGIFGHPLYSPDLAPNDFWLFSYLKKELPGKQYQARWEVESAINATISAIPADEFQKTPCVKWPECMCIISQNIDIHFLYWYFRYLFRYLCYMDNMDIDIITTLKELLGSAVWINNKVFCGTGLSLYWGAPVLISSWSVESLAFGSVLNKQKWLYLSRNLCTSTENKKSAPKIYSAIHSFSK